MVPDEFHSWAQHRRETTPYALTARSTHDTKRSEDVRARLAALAEIPGEWATTVRAWRDLVGTVGDRLPEPSGTEDATGDASNASLDWLAWQTLVGAWPITADRLGGYLVKAAREAKQVTSWTRPDIEVEDRLTEFAGLLCDEPALTGSVAQFVERLHPAFVANVLGQRAVQLVVPGVPDIYQGCEVVSLRLVDPDNRGAVDHSLVTAALDRGLSDVPDPTTDLDAAKARLTAVALGLRRDRPDLIGPAVGYRGVSVHGAAADHAVAIGRGEDLVLVVTRFALRLAGAGGWRDTAVTLPAGRWRCALTGQVLEVGRDALPLVDVLTDWPVALLVREGS
jgi:(1->4)-alpha-D-glucan 1-alpha-D-glucosylmutase